MVERESRKALRVAAPLAASSERPDQLELPVHLVAVSLSAVQLHLLRISSVPLSLPPDVLCESVRVRLDPEPVLVIVYPIVFLLLGRVPVGQSDRLHTPAWVNFLPFVYGVVDVRPRDGHVGPDALHVHPGLVVRYDLADEEGLSGLEELHILDVRGEQDVVVAVPLLPDLDDGPRSRDALLEDPQPRRVVDVLPHRS